jgi:hypothetical protein
MRKYQVTLVRRVGKVVSTFTMDVSASNRRTAAMGAESSANKVDPNDNQKKLTGRGWKTQKVVSSSDTNYEAQGEKNDD